MEEDVVAEVEVTSQVAHVVQSAYQVEFDQL